MSERTPPQLLIDRLDSRKAAELRKAADLQMELEKIIPYVVLEADTRRLLRGKGISDFASVSILFRPLLSFGV